MKGNKIFDFSRKGFQDIINIMTKKINEVIDLANEMIPRLDDYISKIDWNKIINSDLYQKVVGDLEKTNEELNNIKTIVLNVKDFGAKGEGTDDTQAIKRCVAKAMEINANVYFPHGTYGISETIRIFKPIKVYGDGRYSKLIALNELTSQRTDINPDFGAILSIEFNVSHKDEFYGLEGFMDGGSITDLYISGNLRKYNVDGLHLSGIDHFYINNLSIEECKGSAIKMKMVRENNFNNINIRYCGLKHNRGEDRYTKGHPSICVIETINDTSNLNNLSNINIMCSFYTALRTFPGNNKWVNTYCHQLFPNYIGSSVEPILGTPPIAENGNIMDFDVLQVVNTIHPAGASYRIEQFINTGGVWGGYSSPMMSVINAVVNFTGGNLGGHWQQDGRDNGYGIELVNSKLRITGTSLLQNNKLFKTDESSSVWCNGDINTSSQELYNNDVQLVGIMQNYNRTLDLSKEQITLFGGKFIGDRHVYEVVKDSAGRQIEIGGRKTNENGGYFREFNGAIRLGDFTGNDSFSPWVGMIYKNNLNEVICMTNGGSVKIGESLHLRDINTIPSNIRREGTFGWNPNTKKPMYWDGSTWIDM